MELKTLNNLDVIRINEVENVIHSDIDKHFRIDTKNDIKLLENRSAIIQSIWNLLLTSKGELPFLNDYGTNLKQYLYEQGTSDVLDDIKTEFIEELNRWDSRVTVIDVRFSHVEENGKAIVDLLLDTKEGTIKQSFTIPSKK